MTVQNEINALIGKKSKKFIYMDHAATTPMDPRVKKAMEPYFVENFGNPGSFYEVGLKAKMAVTKARENTAKYIKALPEEIIFTGSGTESDNMAIFGVARAKGSGHIITSTIEHHAVEMPCEQLEKDGFKVTYLDVDKYGIVDAKDLKNNLQKDTILVSIMMANNEIGTIQPIKEIGKIIKDFNKKTGANVLFHTDACQAGGSMPIDVKKLGVDLLTLNGSKIYGPKGVGVLYKRKGVKIKPIMYGGFQEAGLRPGTENVPNIVGFAKAFELVQNGMEKENKRLCALRDRMINGIEKSIKKVRLNGHSKNRLPNNVNFTFMDIEGEAFTLFLNELGVYASTGSACTSERLDPSHVIVATGVPYECAHGSVRFTLGHSSTKEDVDYVVKMVAKIVDILRKISPLNLDEKTLKSNLQL